MTIQKFVDSLAPQSWRFLRYLYEHRSRQRPVTAAEIAEAFGLSNPIAAGWLRVPIQNGAFEHRLGNVISNAQGSVDGRAQMFYTYVGSPTWNRAIEARIAREQ